MTPERIAEIRERADRATAGPWGTDDGMLLAEASDEGVLSCCNMDGATLIFIAHARQDVPDLLDALTALQQENARLRAVESERNELLEAGKTMASSLYIENNPGAIAPDVRRAMYVIERFCSKKTEPTP